MQDALYCIQRNTLVLCVGGIRFHRGKLIAQICQMLAPVEDDCKDHPVFVFSKAGSVSSSFLWFNLSAGYNGDILVTGEEGLNVKQILLKWRQEDSNILSRTEHIR